MRGTQTEYYPKRAIRQNISPVETKLLSIGRSTYARIIWLKDLDGARCIWGCPHSAVFARWNKATFTRSYRGSGRPYVKPSSTLSLFNAESYFNRNRSAGRLLQLPRNLRDRTAGPHATRRSGQTRGTSGLRTIPMPSSLPGAEPVDTPHSRYRGRNCHLSRPCSVPRIGPFPHSRSRSRERMRSARLQFAAPRLVDRCGFQGLPGRAVAVWRAIRRRTKCRAVRIQPSLCP